MSQTLCFDQNNTQLNVGDGVMCTEHGNENEGIVTKLLENNRIEMDGENGIIQVNASDVFYLP